MNRRISPLPEVRFGFVIDFFLKYRPAKGILLEDGYPYTEAEVRFATKEEWARGFSLQDSIFVEKEIID